MPKKVQRLITGLERKMGKIQQTRDNITLKKYNLPYYIEQSSDLYARATRSLLTLNENISNLDYTVLNNTLKGMKALKDQLEMLDNLIDLAETDVRTATKSITQSIQEFERTVISTATHTINTTAKKALMKAEKKVQETVLAAQTGVETVTESFEQLSENVKTKSTEKIQHAVEKLTRDVNKTIELFARAQTTCSVFSGLVKGFFSSVDNLVQPSFSSTHKDESRKNQTRRRI